MRADPARFGQPPALQRPAGQLRQRISSPLATGARVVGVGWASQRLQGRQEYVSGFRVQQPPDRHHSLPGRRQPQPTPLVTARGGPVGPVRVGDLAQMGDGLAQPRRVHPPSGLEQHGFGVQLDMVGELVGAVGDHLGVGGRDLAADQSLSGPGEGTAEQGPGGLDAAASRLSAHPQPGPQPGRRRGSLLALVGPGGAAGVQVGELLEPQAFETVQQPPQCQYPLGRTASVRPCRSWTANASTATPSPPRPSGGGGGRWPGDSVEVCSSPWRQPTNPTCEHKHQLEIVENSLLREFEVPCNRLDNRRGGSLARRAAQPAAPCQVTE